MDFLDLEVLEDGTITLKTSAISDANHVNADNLVKELERLMGGAVTKTPNKEALAKAGLKSHTHAHAGGGHSHDGGKTFHHH